MEHLTDHYFYTPWFILHESEVVELAAARTKYFPPQALLSRLEQSLSVLGGGARDLPARQQTLRGTLVWSYGLLSPGEQRLFQRLAVFVDGCTVEAAEEVCQAGGELAVDVLEGLLSLVDKSLLRQQETMGGEARFWMLQVLREFGLELQASGGETERTRQAHASYYLQLAEEAFPVLMGPQPTRWVERLEWEHANLRTALAWWLERTAGAQALRLARALGQFWLYHTYWQEGRDLLEHVLSLAPAEETLVRAEAMGSLGMLLVNLGELRRAEEVMRQHGHRDGPWRQSKR